MTLIIFFILLGVLILSHEFGHFIAAKKAGVFVEEFGIGLPPRIFSIKKGETIYSLNLLPLGGFVKLLGENEPPSSLKDRPALTRLSSRDRSFYHKGFRAKFFILAAGVVMNMFVAYILFVGIHTYGVPTVVEEGSAQKVSGAQVVIVDILENSPAKSAGLQAGDVLLQITSGNESIEPRNPQEVQSFVADHVNNSIVLKYTRANKEFITTVTPSKLANQDRPSIGIAMVHLGITKTPLYKALWVGLVSTYQAFIETSKALGFLLLSVVNGTFNFQNLAGPVGIFQLTSQIYSLGFVYLMQLTAILSINLAILNFLPIPGLDGGRALILVIETLRRRAFNPDFIAKLHGAGIAFLILLILIITYHDVMRLI